MSEPIVTLTIDGVEVSVPKGTLLVDAAKQVGIDIPVFCYHPKLEPVGMCRMCLVEIGRPSRDRATGELLRDEEGNPVIQFGPNLETACTTRVDEGWAVRFNSEKAVEGRNQIVEFLLTSHPLDCPICDKGGECPLQDLTMEHGPGKSRFIYDDKMHLDKHVPLGDLIFLDRERCIQCGRCVRFQDELVDDPVIQFQERGRSLEIVTYSEPGFDSYFSGNTTDICPVGALTTADFRFGARPWELNAAASICTHCPVGCNITLNTRREAKSGGAEVVKRVMPRQNERVNEIWICDKGRLAHHFAGSPERLMRPMVRKNGVLEEVSWEEALQRAAKGLEAAGDSVVGITGGRVSNEDLFNFRLLLEGMEGHSYLHSYMAGGDLVQQVGLGTGSNLGELGEGDVILVIASDLHEEAPIWWMRVKGAVDRGASLIVANARPTRLEKYADYILRYSYGEGVHTILGILHGVTGEKELSSFGTDPSFADVSSLLKEANNVVIFCGAEGLDYDNSRAIAQGSASILVSTNHVGKPNNGLIVVWSQCNMQGAWDMGIIPPSEGFSVALEGSKAVYIMAADPLGNDADFGSAIPQDAFVVIQELFHTATVERADVVFPASSFIEREGSFTSGERIVQRFYPAVQVFGESLPDWQILARLGGLMGIELEETSVVGVMREISESKRDYAGVDYKVLSSVTKEWPPVGGQDLFFGGTAYKNIQGHGIRLPSSSEQGDTPEPGWQSPGEALVEGGMLLVPVAACYNAGRSISSSKVLKPRIPDLHLLINGEDAEKFDLISGGDVELNWNGHKARLPVRIEETVPSGSALLPRGMGIPLQEPAIVEFRAVRE
ncbi:MAG: NADH-quinone oxidoreductase subunit NuoG [Anaerolineales bacterium]|nr:NADH-quinone oxidoreductase subunit NuoG [Anaerolineales bacterium]